MSACVGGEDYPALACCTPPTMMTIDHRHRQRQTQHYSDSIKAMKTAPRHPQDPHLRAPSPSHLVFRSLPKPVSHLCPNPRHTTLQNALDYGEKQSARTTSAELHGTLDRELTMTMLKSPVVDGGAVFSPMNGGRSSVTPAAEAAAADRAASDVPHSPNTERKVSSDLVAGRNLSMLTPLLR